ncbi:MAG: DUF1569 domain-containing protein [Planctomycetota bacterium]
MVDTKHSTDRRKLYFANIDAVLADVDRIVAADKAGTLRCTGNWTAGQVMGHVASWINYAYDGFPIGKPPFFVRWILKMLKKKYLREGMPSGVKIPKTKEGTFGIEKLSTEEGATQLRKALTRLKSSEEAKHDSPAWGPMPRDERIAINLRHAELHLSFLHS